MKMIVSYVLMPPKITHLNEDYVVAGIQGLGHNFFFKYLTAVNFSTADVTSNFSSCIISICVMRKIMGANR